MMMLTRASLQSGLLLVAIAGSALPLSSAAQARSPFDGRWSIEAVADPSRCSVRYTVAVQVANARSAEPTSVPSPGVPWTAMASSSFASTWYAPTARLLPAQAWAGGNPRPAMAPGLHAEPKDDIE